MKNKEKKTQNTNMKGNKINMNFKYKFIKLC